MKKALLSFCIIFMITCWYSCTKDTAPAPVILTGNCDTTKVNFTKDLVPILNASCNTGTSCHSPGAPQKDFTSLVVVQGDIDNILCRIWATGTAHCGARMPSGAGLLPQAQRDLFTQWKADGFYNCQ